MQALSKHGPRIAVSLLPLLLAVLNALGVLPMGALQRLDGIRLSGLRRFRLF